MAEIRYQVTVDSSGAVTSIQKLDDAWKKEQEAAKGAGDKAGLLDRTFGGLWKQMTIGALAAQAVQKGLQLVKDAISGTIEEAMADEQADTRLRASLELTGRTLAGNYSHYKKFAEAQQQVTTYSHDQIEAVQTLLLQLTNLDQKGIDAATKGAMGLASALGMDLQGAAMMVTKAMEGNAMALQRVGIRVDENLSGAEKQAAILDKLQGLYGRSTTETSTFAGTVKQLKNEFAEAQEVIGNSIVQNEDVKLTIREVAQIIREATPEIKEYLIGVVEFIGTLAKIAGGIIKALRDIRKEIGGIDATPVEENVKAWAKFSEKLGGFTPIVDRITSRIMQIGQYSRDVVKAGEDLGTKLWDSYNEIGEKATLTALATGKFGEDGKKALELIGGEALKVLMKAEDLGTKVNEIGTNTPPAVKPAEFALKEMARRTNEAAEAARQWRNFNGDATAGLVNFARNTQTFTQAVYGALAPAVDLTEADKEMAAAFDQIRQQAAEARNALLKMTSAEIRKELREKQKQLKEFGDEMPTDKVQALRAEIRALKGELAEPAWVGQFQASMDLALGYANTAISGMNAITAQAQKNREIEIENEYKQRLDAINANIKDEAERAQAIEALEAEFQIKRTSARRAATKQQKAISLFEAITNTAAGVAGALSNKPWTPVNFVLAAMVAAMGAVQIALIARQPTPLAKGAVFETPTMFATAAGSTYVAGEAGREILGSERAIRQIFQQEFKRTGLSRRRGTPRPLQINIDGRKIAEVLLPDLTDLGIKGRMNYDIAGLVRSES